MKVLVVDDAGVMRKVITRELLDLGIEPMEVHEACDGQEGFKQAVVTKFDLILLDWNMPNMLGIDALAEIRAAGIKTPVIMITTEAEKANIIRAIQTGANNYLTKPFNKQDFQSKIKQVLNLQ